MAVLGLLVTIIWLSCASVQCSPVRKNVTVALGDTVHLRCSTLQEVPVDWTYNGEPFYVNGEIDVSLRSRYSIDKSNDGQYTAYMLVIVNFIAADAGEYKCIDNAGSGPELVTYIIGEDTAALTTAGVAPTKPPEKSGCEAGLVTWVVVCLLIGFLFISISAAVILAVMLHRRSRKTATDNNSHSMTNVQHNPAAATERDQVLTAETSAATERDQVLTAETSAATERDQVLTAETSAATERDQVLTAETSAATEMDPFLTTETSNNEQPTSTNTEPDRNDVVSKETAEADLKKVQENLTKRLSESDAAIPRTNHLDKQIDGLTSQLQEPEHERTRLVLNIDDLKRQLKDITQASESIKKQMEKRIKNFENYETKLLEKLDAVEMELVTKENELKTAENDIREQKTGQKVLQLKYENAQRMVDKLTESKENLTTELEQAKEKRLQQVARSEELQSRVSDLESQLAEVHRQLQRKDAEKTQVKSQLNSMVEELQRLDRDSLDYQQQLDELQTQLKHRQDSEANLEGQLKQAKDDATLLRNLLRQRSEEMKEIKSEREELRHQQASASTPLGQLWTAAEHQELSTSLDTECSSNDGEQFHRLTCRLLQQSPRGLQSAAIRQAAAQLALCKGPFQRRQPCWHHHG